MIRPLMRSGPSHSPEQPRPRSSNAETQPGIEREPGRLSPSGVCSFHVVRPRAAKVPIHPSIGRPWMASGKLAKQQSEPDKCPTANRQIPDTATSGCARRQISHQHFFDNEDWRLLLCPTSTFAVAAAIVPDDSCPCSLPIARLRCHRPSTRLCGRPRNKYIREGIGSGAPRLNNPPPLWPGGNPKSRP